MSGDRVLLGTPATADGPWLAAILSRLDDLHDLLDGRLPKQAAASAADGTIELREPAPAAEPASEPAVLDEPAQTAQPKKRVAKVAKAASRGTR